MAIKSKQHSEEIVKTSEVITRNVHYSIQYPSSSQIYAMSPNTPLLRSYMRGTTLLNRATKTRRVREILDTFRPERAGIIPYRITENGLLFCLGVDRRSGDLTDFGGGISYYRRCETPVQAALREFSEETLGIFGEINMERVNRSVALLDNANLIILLLLDEGNINSEKEIFMDNLSRSPDAEVSNIIWLTETELRRIVSGADTSTKMYDRIKKLISDAGSFYSYLRYT